MPTAASAMVETTGLPVRRLEGQRRDALARQQPEHIFVGAQEGRNHPAGALQPLDSPRKISAAGRRRQASHAPDAYCAHRAAPTTCRLPTTGEFMRTNFAILAIAASSRATPSFAAGPADILAANKAATGGAALGPARPPSRRALRLFRSGHDRQGHDDRRSDATAASSTTPRSGRRRRRNGFDGTHAWAEGPVRHGDASGRRRPAPARGQRSLSRRESVVATRISAAPQVVSDGAEDATAARPMTSLTVTPKDGKAFRRLVRRQDASALSHRREAGTADHHHDLFRLSRRRRRRCSPTKAWSSRERREIRPGA